MERLVPKKYQKLYEKAISGRSRKAAIRSFCIECVGYFEKEVRACTDPECPLYLYRLYGGGGGLQNRQILVSQKIYVAWREFILKKFNHICVNCGADKTIVVHHLVPINENATLIVDKNNGVTLCTDCHSQIHSGKLILGEFE